MQRDEDIAKVLSTYPISDIWGIGRRHSKMLEGCYIRTAAQFYALSEEWIRNRMNINGVRTWRELHGTPCIEFNHQIADKQTITVSRSFAKELYEFDDIHETISTFASLAAEKLRQQHSLTRMLQVFILTNRHRDDRPQHYEGAAVHFPVPTDSSLEIVKAATTLLRKIYRKGYGYKKTGVTLGDISSGTIIQGELFDTIDRPKHRMLMEAIDKINATQGHEAVRLVSQGSISDHSNRQYLSPQYTTKWEDIPLVKV